jgi:hypothetical protein
MSFEPISYKYNPPPTLATPPAAKTAAATIVSVSLPSQSSTSRATELIGKLQDLKDTSNYLIQIISLKSQGIAVALDPSVDVNVAMALGRIYGTDNPPSGISLPMFNCLLDAEVGMVRSDIVVKPESSPVIPFPLQRADLQISTTAFEKALVSTGTFDNQLPTLLRQLKTDQVVFDNFSEGLGKYPAAAPPGTETLPAEQATLVSPGINSATSPVAVAPADVNDNLYNTLSAGTDAWAQAYAYTYDLLAGVNDLTEDAITLANQMVGQTVDTVNAAIGIIQSLIALFHKKELATIQKGLIWMVYPVLLSEIGNFAMIVDRLFQKVTAPVFSLVNSLGQVFGQIARSANLAGFVLGGGLTGSIKARISGSNQPPSESELQTLSNVPQSLSTISAALGWGVSEMTNKKAFLESSLSKAMARRTGATGDRLEALKSLQTMESALNIMGSISTQAAASKGNTLSPTTISNVAQSYTPSSLSLNGGSSILTPPALPTPPANVQALLLASGSAQIARTAYVAGV